VATLSRRAGFDSWDEERLVVDSIDPRKRSLQAAVDHLAVRRPTPCAGERRSTPRPALAWRAPRVVVMWSEHDEAAGQNHF
jgi:hypothetical protein